MKELFTSVSTVIESLLSSFTTVSKFLLNNELFQIMFGIIVLYLGISFVMYLVKQINQNKTDRPYKRATGMTKAQFEAEMNRKYLEKFPTYEAKLKHLGIK